MSIERLNPTNESIPSSREDQPPRVMTTRHSTFIGGKRYDVYKLIEAARNIPIETMSLSLFEEYQDEDNCWNLDDEEEKLGPKQLLELAREYQNDWQAMTKAKPEWAEHIRKVQQADYKKYPLLITGDNKIIDGMHRLTRAFIDQEVTELTIQRFLEMPIAAEIHKK